MLYMFFVDFDGTITTRDSCDLLLQRFGAPGADAINELWESKQISTCECAQLTLGEMSLTSVEIGQLVDEVKIDPYFRDFLELCSRYAFPVLVLSDGYDQIINGVFEREQIDLPYWSNSLRLEPRCTANFPYYNQHCGQCGTCKSNLIKVMARDGFKKVYIGDGKSDFCPVSLCEVVFAKGRLKEYCSAEHIGFFEYLNFKDVVSWLKKVGVNK